jgi:hypothetical protein
VGNTWTLPNQAVQECIHVAWSQLVKPDLEEAASLEPIVSPFRPIGRQQQNWLVADARHNSRDGRFTLGVDPMQILNQNDNWLVLRLQRQKHCGRIPGPSGAIRS